MTAFTLLTWLLLIWSLGWLSLPIARRIWAKPTGSLPDGGLAAGRLIVMWAWTLLAFWLGNAGVSARVGAFLIYPLAGVLLYYWVRDWTALQIFIKQRRRALICSDAVFLAVFAIFFVLRGFWPDINNGEKPMDMVLIASLGNTASLPPPNGYAAGLRLTSYYYLGHYQTALLGNALGIIPRWSYNLMSATLPALCYSVLAPLAGAVTNRFRNGLAATILLLTAGTLEPLRQWFMPPPGAPAKRWPLDYFATSRVIPNTINEYPWFTFAYADLHAHYFAMPLVLVIISLGWALYWQREAFTSERFPKILAGICALALGALLITNSWDFPVYAVFIGFCLVSLKILQETLPDASASVKTSASVAAFSVRASDGNEDQEAFAEVAASINGNGEEPKESVAQTPKPRARKAPIKKLQLQNEPEKIIDDVDASTPPRRTRRPALKTEAAAAAADATTTARAPKTIGPKRIRAAATTKSTSQAAPPRLAVTRAKPPAPLHTNPFVRAGLITVAIGAIAIICALPFLMDLHSDAQGPDLLDQPGSPTGAWVLLWAPIAGAWVLTLVTEARNRLALGSSEAVLMKRFVFIPIALWLVAMIATGNDHFVLIFLATITVWTAREAFFVQREDQVYTWLCRTALCGLLALVWSETTWAGFLSPPYHRQDTVFKFGIQAWYLLGIAAACAALRSTPTATSEEPESPDVMAWRFWPRAAQLIFALMLAVCFAATVSTTIARAQDFAKFEGWDAWTHLAMPERKAAAFLYKQARDGVFLIEAEEKEGGDYSEFTRYAHTSGVPGVIGPQAHTFQWGVAWDVINERKKDVRAFYTTADAAQAAEILKKYSVSFVVCGEMERREYGAEAVERVEERLRAVFQDGEGDERTTILAAQ